MIRSALFLCAGIIIAACFACTPAPRPFSGGSGTGTGTGNKICTAQDFANAALMLPAGYDPGGLQPPTGNYSSVTPNSPIWNDLAAAFTAAPPKLQPRLCLTTIYINQTACNGSAPCFGANSWGFRNPNNTAQRYIALSQTLWPGGGQSAAPPYSQYETASIAQVLAQLKPTSAPWPTPTAGPSNTIPTPPTFSTAMYVPPTGPSIPVDKTGNGTTSGMTVLAALAHEYGHILWYDLIKGAGTNYNYFAAGFCRQNPNAPGDGFFDKSWHTVTNPDTFQPYAAPSPDQHAGSIQTGDLVSQINSQDWLDAVNSLNTMYSINPEGTDLNAVWPSLFGSISAEEDFAETFKMFVMTRPNTNQQMPVNSMPLNLFAVPNTTTPTQMPDIYQYIAKLKKKDLKHKFDCIDNRWSSLDP